MIRGSRPIYVTFSAYLPLVVMPSVFAMCELQPYLVYHMLQNIFNRWMPCSHPSARRLHSKSWVAILTVSGQARHVLKCERTALNPYISYERDCNHDKKNGICHVHAGITAQDVQEKLDSVPGAEFLIHPECSCTSSICMMLLPEDTREEKLEYTLLKA